MTFFAREPKKPGDKNSPSSSLEAFCPVGSIPTVDTETLKPAESGVMWIGSKKLANGFLGARVGEVWAGDRHLNFISALEPRSWMGCPKEYEDEEQTTGPWGTLPC